MGIFKTIFRTGVVLGVLTAIAVGGMVLVGGSERTAAFIGDVQTSVVEIIDTSIDDPAAMRHQLRKLQADYPERIGAVRADLAEIHEEIRQLERERAISERVVEMTSEDLAALDPLISNANDAVLSGSHASLAAATVRFENRLYTLDRAHSRAEQIRSTNNAYAARAADAEHDLGYLEQQAARLAQILVQLENERAQFEAQLTQLDRQIDAIARNERLIQLMEKRHTAIEAHSRYEAQSIEHFVARLSQVRTRQEAELDTLANAQRRVDYEDVARMQLEAEQARGAMAPVNELVPVR